MEITEETTLEEAKKINATLRTELKAEIDKSVEKEQEHTTSKTELEEKVTSLETEKSELEQKISDADDSIKEKDTKMSELEEKIQTQADKMHKDLAAKVVNLKISLAKIDQADYDEAFKSHISRTDSSLEDSFADLKSELESKGVSGEIPGSESPLEEDGADPENKEKPQGRPTLEELRIKNEDSKK